MLLLLSLVFTNLPTMGCLVVNCSVYHVYMEDLRSPNPAEVVKLDAVGGAALLVDANLHRYGIYQTPTAMLQFPHTSSTVFSVGHAARFLAFVGARLNADECPPSLT